MIACQGKLFWRAWRQVILSSNSLLCIINLLRNSHFCRPMWKETSRLSELASNSELRASKGIRLYRAAVGWLIGFVSWPVDIRSRVEWPKVYENINSHHVFRWIPQGLWERETRLFTNPLAAEKTPLKPHSGTWWWGCLGKTNKKNFPPLEAKMLSSNQH